MPFPTTSCDLSPVTGTTPGAGSMKGGARGWLGSGIPVLGGWDRWGWWLRGLLTDSRKAPSRGRVSPQFRPAPPESTQPPGNFDPIVEKALGLPGGLTERTFGLQPQE